MSIFKDSIILITGGTGTFGATFAEYCLQKGAKEVRIFSRHKQPQLSLAQQLNDKRIKLYVGDILNKEQLNRATIGADYVLHSAAMKKIPDCEKYPLKAIEASIVGSKNVLEAAINNKIKKVVCLSSDKAVNPVSMMGFTKKAMEKIAISEGLTQSNTSVCIVRFCNLIASSGSVIPLFMQQVKSGQPLTITDPEMTRFMITLRQAVELVDAAFTKGENGDIFVKNTKSVSLENIGKAVYNYLNIWGDYSIKITGARNGDKKHESLITEEELEYVYGYKDYFVISTVKNPEPIIDMKEFFSEFNQMSPQETLQLIKDAYDM